MVTPTPETARWGSLRLVGVTVHPVIARMDGDAHQPKRAPACGLGGARTACEGKSIESGGDPPGRRTPTQHEDAILRRHHAVSLPESRFGRVMQLMGPYRKRWY